MLNTNYPRDYFADIVTDIAAAEEGHACPECGNPLKAARGVEVGNIFKLGTRYSDSLGCTFLDRDGQQKPVIMGSYGIGVGRLLACVAEEHHDEHGLIWPVTVAPYQVHLVLLRGKNTPQAAETADLLYTDLQAAGLEVLYDDRDESDRAAGPGDSQRTRSQPGWCGNETAQQGRKGHHSTQGSSLKTPV